jgi:hypothetical protein
MVIRNRMWRIGILLFAAIDTLGCGFGDKEENRRNHIKFRPAPPASVTGSPQPEPPAALNDLCLLSRQGVELDFGQVDVGRQVSQSVTLTNTCGYGVMISRVALSGASPAAFSITTRHDSLVELAPGGSVTIELLFEPPERGEVEGELLIHTSSASAEGLLRVSLRGRCESL